MSVFHRKNGVNSQALTLTLFTTAACTTSATINPPTGFNVTSCTAGTTNGKPNATYHVHWTAGANPGTSIFHIGESFSNNSARSDSPRADLHRDRKPGALHDRGRLVTVLLGPHANGAQASSWVALLGNPIVISNGCSGAL